MGKFFFYNSKVVTLWEDFVFRSLIMNADGEYTDFLKTGDENK